MRLELRGSPARAPTLGWKQKQCFQLGLRGSTAEAERGRPGACEEALLAVEPPAPLQQLASWPLPVISGHR